MAFIRIETATGALVTDGFRIDRETRVSDLKRIDADTFEILHEYRDFLSCYVARVAVEDWLIGISAHVIDSKICRLRLFAFRAGDSWENFTTAKDEQARRFLLRLLDGSKLHPEFRAAWGRVAIEYENRNCYHFLAVIYREIQITRD